MLTHDPFEPMIRAKMEERWELAARARLRRSALTRHEPVAPSPSATPRPNGWLRSLARFIRGARPAMES